jgi:hypothetical protein
VISYFTPGSGGTIEVAEAATELVVPNGGRTSIGGSSSTLHAITRQVPDIAPSGPRSTRP